MNIFISRLFVGADGENLLYTMVLLPVLFSVICLLLSRKKYTLSAGVHLFAVTVNLLGAAGVFFTRELIWTAQDAGFGIEMSFRIYNFSQFILLAAAVSILLTGIYSISFMKEKSYSGRFFCLILLTTAMANGAVLANNPIAMLFFWEGMLCTFFGFLLIKNTEKPETAVKMLTLSGIANMLLMLGIVVTVFLSEAHAIDEIVPIPVEGLGILGYTCLMLGVIGKAGALPFHSWIPDAVDDAPLPFLIFSPASLEKLLSIYLLIRASTDFYTLKPGSAMSISVMTIGVLTLVFASAMALIQKDMKKMLAYHTVSQAGYMILGIGTGLPVGILGALYCMLSYAVYMSGLFMTAGAIEHRMGTTDLKNFSGLGRKMPFTMLCFIIFGLSISGVPPMNGFFSLELLFDASLESGVIFYIGLLLGVFMTAASFLNIGHAAFFGKEIVPKGRNAKEAPTTMLVPMGILAALCILLGVFNSPPLRGVFQPILSDILNGNDYAGWPHPFMLVLVSIIVLLTAVLDHIYGWKKNGNNLSAVHHIRYAPVLRSVYDKAEKHWFDPYNLLMSLFTQFSKLCFKVERMINDIYDVLLKKVTISVASGIHVLANGSLSRYLALALAGFMFLLIFLIAAL